MSQHFARRSLFGLIGALVTPSLAACARLQAGPADGSQLDGKWTVTGATGPDAAMPADGDTATMKFDGNKVTGHDSINAFQGTITITGDTITFSDMTIGAVGTVGDVGKGPHFINMVITSKPRYRIDGDALTLTGTEGRTLILSR